MKCTIKNGKYYAPNGAESILYKSLREKVSEDEANDLFVLTKTPTFIETVKISQKETDKNGEIKAEVVFKYVENNFSQVTPLTAVEKSHLINLQIEGVETSTDLYNILYSAFYKNNFFSPNINKLNKIYDENEIRNILENSEIQGRVKETVEKLRSTEEFDIPTVKINKDFEVISDKVNIIGQYKKQNPLKLEADYIQENTDTDIQNTIIDLSDYSRVEVVNEDGEQVETQLFYENAIKQPSEESLGALKAVIGAHPMVDTEKLENKIIESFKGYGMNIEGLVREDFPKLLEFVTAPTENNRKSLEEALGFISVIDSKVVKGLPKNRTYQYLKTAKSEQELFDEMSLIQTTTPNVYHKVNKIDEQEIRDIQENQDLTVPDYQLYKDYYGYNVIDVKKEQLQIINSSNPAPNNYNTWIRSVEDIKIAEDVFKTAFEEGAMYPDFTESDMKKVLQSGKVTIHSSYPIKEGVFVTPSKMNAQEYAGGKNGKIYTKEVNVNDIAWIDESEGQYAPISYKKEFVKPIQTNIQTDTNYLLNSFIADFAAEKLKNPTEFNRQFKITSEGIELTSNDDITIAIVKSYIQDGGKYTKEIADYSLLSKEMPNLKEKSLDFITSKQDRKIEAINNIDKVAPFKESITILDDDSLYAPGESAEFLKIDNNIYEMQEQGYYNRIEKNTNPNFFDLNIQQPKFKDFDLKQGESAEIKIKKLVDKETNNEFFSCL